VKPRFADGRNVAVRRNMRRRRYPE